MLDIEDVKRLIGASDEATGIAWIPMPGPISRMDHRCEDRGCAANARANGSPSAQPGSNARDEAWEPNLMLQYRVTKAATLATTNHRTTHAGLPRASSKRVKMPAPSAAKPDQSWRLIVRVGRPPADALAWRRVYTAGEEVARSVHHTATWRLGVTFKVALERRVKVERGAPRCRTPTTPGKRR